MMNRPAFLITIDTEGDNLWARGREITTENTRFLPRFQALCERFGFKPTYLTNYEMASDDRFVRFASAAATARMAEVGMHLHAWDSPPIRPLTEDDFTFHPYLTEFPREAMAEKISFMTGLLSDRFERKIESHRGGRWAFDETYAQLLVEHGYLIDCSVTPHVSWRGSRAQAAGVNGPDFRSFPQQPYWVDPGHVASPGRGTLLETPMTIRPKSRPVSGLFAGVPGLRGVLQRYWPRHRWLRPNGANTRGMLDLLQEVEAEGAPYAMFMLHSSELMPGGSPSFRDGASIENLYRQLETLFAKAARSFTGMTLSEFRSAYATSTPSAAVCNLAD